MTPKTCSVLGDSSSYAPEYQAYLRRMSYRASGRLFARMRRRDPFGFLCAGEALADPWLDLGGEAQ